MREDSGGKSAYGMELLAILLVLLWLGCGSDTV